MAFQCQALVLLQNVTSSNASDMDQDSRHIESACLGGVPPHHRQWQLARAPIEPTIGRARVGLRVVAADTARTQSHARIGGLSFGTDKLAADL